MKFQFNKILVALFFSFLVQGTCAQQNGVSMASPFDFPLYLSGNFGELRTDHFHAGLDFKTKGVVGLPVRCVADGYICRVSVTPGGYGKALYVMHDNGYMTVYGHLDRFPEEIEKRVRDFQYKKESFRANIWFRPGEFPLKKGEFLAYAGNSGYSFGPHLHFEVRDASGNELYDPLVLYKNEIKDTTPPKVHSLAVYSRAGKGALAGCATSRTFDVNGGVVPDTIEAWGDIAFGIKALDYMDGTHNKYGIYKIELFVDGECCFLSCMDRFSFREDLLINAWIDYGRFYNNNEWYQKLFISGRNPLRAIKEVKNDGWLHVGEERVYNVVCRVGDLYGNTSCCSVVVRGKKTELAPYPKASHTLYWSADNRVDYLGLRLDVPRGTLFEDAFLDMRLQEGSFMWRYKLTDTVYPMMRGAKLSLWVGDKLPVDKSKLYIRHVEPGDSSYVGGVYADGWITADIPVLDCYEVAVDTVAPVLSPVDKEKWLHSGVVAFSVDDADTSLGGFKGTVDGKFVLFEYNSKNKRLVLNLKREGVRAGIRCLRLVVTDKCGNETVFEEEINIK